MACEGAEARGRDLLHVPAARLRPADPRRRALQNLPVLFAIDRAGLVGGDGATHQGSYDSPYLRCIPNMVVMAPADENECRQMLYTGYDARRSGGGALSARQRPRRCDPVAEMTALPIGQGARCAARARGGLLSRLRRAGDAARKSSASDSTPPSSTCASSSRSTRSSCSRSRARHTAHSSRSRRTRCAGGAGSAIIELLATAGVALPALHIGIPDRFIEHGSREDCLAAAELDLAEPRSRGASAAGNTCQVQAWPAT